MKAYQRMLNYVKVNTTSDPNAPESVCPSTPNQKVLAQSIAEEMKSLKIKDVRMDQYGYVYGTLEANCNKKLPVIGLIAHMDTSDSAPGEGIKARIIEKYPGGDIVLNQGKSIVMRADEYQSLSKYIGNDLIVTDGTTLLGADDKAGIAEILTAVEELEKREIRHGTIKIAITPDEEIGRGADHFDVKGFGADYAYTVDGETLGEIECENFNAASADITINGINLHPGYAKNKMKNAILIGMEFNSMLPPCETPTHTEGYEGFYHLSNIKGTEEKTVLQYIIRDHDRNKFEERKNTIQKIVDYLNNKYGSGTAEMKLKDSYYNMKEKIEPYPFIVERIQKAIRDAGVTPKIVPIRGGTDGARLSFMGLPCPNLSACGHNFHSRFEYISIQAMDQMVEVLCKLLSE